MEQAFQGHLLEGILSIKGFVVSMMQPGITTSWRKFRFLRQLGRGGFGEVYLAEMNTGGGFTKPVAIKLLRPDFAQDKEIFKRLEDEARLLGQLRHPNIVQADDLIFLGGRLAMVMEYVPGANLNWVINPKLNPHPIPPRITLQIIRRIADALAAAWSRPTTLTNEPLRVLHRDIKPSNVRVTEDGEVKVLDFGVARVEAFEDNDADESGVRVGSRPYMAPESLLDNPAGPTTDVYSLGVLLYETAARLRFGRCGLELAQHRSEVEARINRAIFKGFQGERKDELITLLREMTAFQPELRPDAATVVERLRAMERTIDGPSLDEWCPKVIPDVAENHKDPEDGELVGQTLSVEPATGTESAVDPSGGFQRPAVTLSAPTEEVENQDDEITELGAESPLLRALPGEPESELESVAGSDTSAHERRRRGFLVALVFGIIVVGAVALSFALPGDETGAAVEAAPLAPPTERSDSPDEVPADGASGAPADAATPAPPVDGDARGSEPAAPADPVQGEAAPDAGLAVEQPAPAEQPAPTGLAGADAAPETTQPAAAPDELPAVVDADEPEALDAPTGAMVDAAFSSRPLGVGVLIDGVYRGNTPLRIQLTAGPHSLAFDAGGQAVVRQVTVGEGAANLWTFYEDEGAIR